MEGRPLAEQFCPWTRVNDFVGRSARILVRRYVADTISAGLNGVHLDRGEFLKDVSAFLKLDPVILNILTRGEMPIIAVIFARDMRQHAHLR